jgi:peptidoglycan/LPS O-acetylase OafA/YrhL
MTAKTDFEPRLESLRGIAALVVATHHGLTSFDRGNTALGSVGDSILYVLLQLFPNPGMAVLFFFVLSGYVLGQSLERDGNYFHFMVRRTFRIFPALIVAVLFAYTSRHFFQMDIEAGGISTFFKGCFWPLPSLADLRDNLLLRTSVVDGPTWSIVWEVYGSAALPIFVFLHRGINPLIRIPLFVVLSVFILLHHTSAYLLPVVWYFYAGFFLPTLIVKYLPNYWLARALAFAVGFWLVRACGPTTASLKLTIFEASIGGAMMIGAVLSSADFLGWLRWKPFRFLGRVSYSFYVLHFPIFYLTTAFAVWSDIVPRDMIGNVIICAVSVAIALSLSALVYSMVEKPSIQLGRWLLSLRPVSRDGFVGTATSYTDHQATG